jgi:hypothetical protein
VGTCRVEDAVGHRTSRWPAKRRCSPSSTSAAAADAM